MNTIAAIIGLGMLLGLIIGAAAVQKEEDRRLTKRFYNEYPDYQAKKKDEV